MALVYAKIEEISDKVYGTQSKVRKPTISEVDDYLVKSEKAGDAGSLVFQCGRYRLDAHQYLFCMMLAAVALLHSGNPLEIYFPVTDIDGTDPNPQAVRQLEYPAPALTLEAVRDGVEVIIIIGQTGHMHQSVDVAEIQFHEQAERGDT